MPITANWQKSNNVWGGWATFGFGLVVGIAVLITEIIVIIPIAFYKMFTTPDSEPSQLAESLVYNGLVLSLATCASTVVCVGFILFLIKIRFHE